MKAYVKLIRPHHWLKNMLVVLPAFFGGRIFDVPVLLPAIYAILSFCLLSSSVYVVNDVFDAKQDKKHPQKMTRPVASGAITIKKAWSACAFLLAGAMILCYLACGFDYLPWLIFFAYLAANIGYSLGLKNIPLIDVSILVSGFILRLFFGSVVTGIAISSWLYLAVMSLSFYMGLGKRRNELKKHPNDTRKVLRHYTYDFLDKNLYMCLVLSLVFYSLWARSYDDEALLIWTTPLVILICMKYNLTIEGDNDGDPVSVLMQDKVLIVLLLLLVFALMAIIYF